jgi:holo-[acyl-carrier protein] synthase
MEIVGLGTQVVECGRLRQLLDRHADAFLERVFTPAERLYCGARVQSAEHYAATWAAKQATLRALGLAWDRGTDWTAIEVRWGNPPTVTVARGLAAGVAGWHVALAHCRSHATATVIAMRG